MSGDIIHFDFSQPKSALVMLNHNMVLFEQNSSSSIEIKPKANNENDVILQLNNSDGVPGAQGGELTTDLTVNKTMQHIVDVIYSSFLFDNIEQGFESKTYRVINELAKSYGFELIDMALTQVILKYIISSEAVVICKSIALLTEFDVDEIPAASVLAITSFSHKKSDAVKEMVLMSIETWKPEMALKLLEDMEPYNKKYLERYRQKVIKMLKGR
ncbi:hypothetical protein ABUK00_07745 [Raoultella planticola]|uniref:hypothetical protein n=1 Tax=Raoultella planticola TaxID=575 RepID=UPI002AB47C8E|nr:hypothetical protein [Raoultella planticola]MDY7622546.1 hypothetical protein [Raoultella planticola]